MPLTTKEMYEFGPFSLDPAERLISRDGVPLSLTPKVFDTLVCLVRKRGRLLTKDELLKELWPDTFVDEVNLAVNISTLRKALGENAHDARYIATVPGHGYRFVAEVREIPQRSNGEFVPTGRSERFERALREHSRGGILAASTSPESNNAGAVPWSFFTSRGVIQRGAILVLVLMLALLVVGLYLQSREKRRIGTAMAPTSIAVLPFADLSAGKDQEYFSDGLAEELINYLAKVPSVRVVARSSSFQFKGKNEDLREVGRKLGVANILEGSVQRDGDRIRIMAELVKVGDGFQLWSQTYERRIDDIFSVQDEIARAVTGTLQVKLLDAKGEALSARPRTSPETYQAYLQSQYFFDRGDNKDDLDHALAYAEKAITLDRKYAPPWVVRSSIYNEMAGFGLIDNAQGMRKSREYAQRAIALDPNLASAYTALGDIQLSYDWDWAGAESSLNRASDLEAGSADVLRYKSLLYESQGRLQEAIEVQKQAITLDPLRARSYSGLAARLYEAGQYDEARAEYEKALELNPQKEHDHAMLGEILLAQGRPREALFEMTQDPRETWRVQGEALAYDALGRKEESETCLQRMIATEHETMAFQIAEVYAFRGEFDKAFEWLEHGYRVRDGGLMYVKVDPLLKGLRQDPRYKELLGRMHLPN